MKKISVIVLVLAVMMMLTLVASAAVGTVVNATKTDKAPNMEAIDDSWGQPAIVINSSSPNTELYDYYSEKSISANLLTRGEYDVGIATGVKPENYDVELYYLWDGKYLYFGMKTKDDVLAGHSDPWEGDGFQMWIQPMGVAESSGALKNGVNTHHEQNPMTGMYDFSVTLDMDDWTTNSRSNDKYANAASECDCYINPEVDGELQCMIKIPLMNLGLNPKNDLVGEELATALLRISSTRMVGRSAYNGWLSWGKYFNDSTCTSLNTIVLTDGSAPAETEDTTPQETEDTKVETPINLEGVSSWALTEVEAGIKEGLVPENLQANYTSPVSRGAVAGMFINLIEKATGKTIDEVMAEKGVSITEGVFEDTTDRNVLAANALGIINGTSKTKFSPNGTLKRAQIAAIINRVARVLGIETEGFTHEFNDITDNYAWADSELGWPVHAGIINGVGQGRFNPGGDLTTEQAILITYRGLSALKK